MAEGKRHTIWLNDKGFFAFEDLEVYRLSVEASALVYDLTKGFPADERFGLTNQLRRAAPSVTLNIAEGHGRGNKDFARFLRQARGSLYELVSGLHPAVRLWSLPEADTLQVSELARELPAKLTASCHTLGST